MAIKSWPYLSIGGDRKTTAGEEAEGFALFVDTGVVPGEGVELAVSKVTDTLNATINTGAAIITGHRAASDAVETVMLDAGSAQARIDVICLESNENTGVRAARFVVVKGTPAASPSIPALTQDGTVWQMPLARITVPAGAGTLNSAAITDMRAYVTGRHNHDVGAVDGLSVALAGKSDTGHTHDSRYYTEAEIDTKLAGKANSSHTHDSRYYTEAEIDTKLAGKANSSHTQAISTVTGLQGALDGKQATITGAASTIASANLSTNKVVVTTAGGKIGTSALESGEVYALAGITGNVQSQLNNKAPITYYGTSATPPSASGKPNGTLYVQYS